VLIVSLHLFSIFYLLFSRKTFWTITMKFS
jgi:hypothetical protein